MTVDPFPQKNSVACRNEVGISVHSFGDGQCKKHVYPMKEIK